MSEAVRRPGPWLGALVGALLTLALSGLLFLAQRAAGLPFLPFALFERAARILPGRVLTFGIDTMVSVIRALGVGPTSVAAKAAEEAIAAVAFLLLGTLLGALFFVVLRRVDADLALPLGLALGALLGVVALLAGLSGGASVTAGPWLAGAWMLVSLVGWGGLLGWSYERLAGTAVAAGAADGVERLDRRTFLIRLGGASAVVTVAGAVVGELIVSGDARQRAIASGQKPWSATHPLPNAGGDVAPVPGTRAELTPVPRHYRIDIDTRPPAVDEEEWRLRVLGRVERPVAFTLDELRRYPALDQFITLECISNYVGGDLIGTTRWTGVSLQRLLPALGLRPEATHLLIRSADDYYEAVDLAMVRADPRIMLAYAWDGLPLPREHGFPLRIYVPDVFGMKQPKWIISMEAIDHWEAGYWVVRGWDARAQVAATSVIDAVGDRQPSRPAGGDVVPVGGIAYAGARGISRVELRTDDGEWAEARLRAPLSDLTWVVWRYEWPFQPGEHTLTVRCRDGDGTPQIAEPSPPHPDGATGLVRKRV